MSKEKDKVRKKTPNRMIHGVGYFGAVVVAVVITFFFSSTFNGQVDQIGASFLKVANDTTVTSVAYQPSNIFEDIGSTEKIDESMIANAGGRFGVAFGYYGKLLANSVHLSVTLYAGAEFLARGAVIENGVLPNQDGLTRVAGHNGLIGYKLNKLEVGDTFILRGPAGDFEYRIYEKGVANETDQDTFMTRSGVSLNPGNIAMIYTCWPIDSTSTDERLYVKGSLV
jgi:hypothetical protein